MTSFEQLVRPWLPPSIDPPKSADGSGPADTVSGALILKYGEKGSASTLSSSSNASTSYYHTKKSKEKKKPDTVRYIVIERARNEKHPSQYHDQVRNIKHVTQSGSGSEWQEEHHDYANIKDPVHVYPGDESGAIRITDEDTQAIAVQEFKESHQEWVWPVMVAYRVRNKDNPSKFTVHTTTVEYQITRAAGGSLGEVIMGAGDLPKIETIPADDADISGPVTIYTRAQLVDLIKSFEDSA